MPAISKIAAACELFVDEVVSNMKLKSGKTVISTCKLCLQPFFDRSPTRKSRVTEMLRAKQYLFGLDCGNYEHRVT